MLKLTFIPDGSSSSNLVLCNTTRSITELDVKFNHRRVLSIENLCEALGSGKAALAQDFANHRNTIALKVRRDCDFGDSAPQFPDAEAAFAFALDQPALFTRSGIVEIRLQGVTTNVTRWLLNCGLEGLNMADWLGVAPSFDYILNGGLITSDSPF